MAMSEFFDCLCETKVSAEILAQTKAFLQDCVPGQSLKVTCMMPDDVVFQATYSSHDDGHLHFVADDTLFHMPWGRLRSIAK